MRPSVGLRDIWWPLRGVLAVLLLGVACGCDDEHDAAHDPSRRAGASQPIVLENPTYRLTVLRWEPDARQRERGLKPIAFTTREARKALDQATRLLIADHDGERTSDVACRIRFELDGEVAGFTDRRGGYIYSKSDWLRVANKPGCVKIVKGIWACGRHKRERSKATWQGCGQVPPLPVRDPARFGERGQKFVVRREFEVDWWGRLWAHEFGHTQGIPDHEGRSIHEIMFEKISQRTVRVDAATCETFRRKRHPRACGQTDDRLEGVGPGAAPAGDGGR